MTRHIHGHRVVAQPCDGLRSHWRVRCDGVFCGLIAHDQKQGWHTIPRTLIGVQSPPVCHAPTCELALSSLIAEVVG